MQLMELVPSDLKEPLLTAKWEKELESIAKGENDGKKFIGNIRHYTTDLVKMVKNSTAQYTPDNLTRTPCPQCGKMMLEVHGKRGKKCWFARIGNAVIDAMFPIKTNARCPNCHKTMELFGEGDKKTYVCSCGFREKAESFHKRKKESSGGSKREVQNYLRDQNKKSKSRGNESFGHCFAKCYEK